MKNLKPITNKDLDGKPIVFISVDRVTNPSLEGAHYKPAEIIPSEDIVYDVWTDEKTGDSRKGERTIRYVPGSRSIFADEQEPGSEKRKGEIIIYNGIKVVEQRETLLLAFMRKCNWNEGNSATRLPNKPVLFKENKRAVVAQESIDKDYLLADVIIAVREMKVDHLLAYAKSLGKDTNKEVAEIRHDMVTAAKLNPKKFFDGINDPRMHRKYIMLEAIDMNVLARNSHSNTVGWSNGNILVQGGPGEDAVDVLVERTMADREGEVIFTQIKNMMNPYMDNSLSTDMDESKDPVDEYEALISNCVHAGSIEQRAAWYVIGAEKWQKKQLLKELKTNPELKKRLELGLKAPSTPLSL